MELHSFDGSLALDPPRKSFGAGERSSVTSIYQHRTRVLPDSASIPHTETDQSLAAKSDEALITMFKAGDRHTFKLLVERHQDRVRNLIFSIFHDPAVVEDIAQEVFIKAYEALDRFRFESSFYTWVYRIAVNKSRDELRKRKFRRFFSFQNLDEGIAEELEARIAVPPADRDTAELVTLGLNTLPEKFRTAIVLKDLEGLSYEEIADVMQCEIGTVKSRLSRARAMLRKALQPLLQEI